MSAASQGNYSLVIKDILQLLHLLCDFAISMLYIFLMFLYSIKCQQFGGKLTKTAATILSLGPSDYL